MQTRVSLIWRADLLFELRGQIMRHEHLSICAVPDVSYLTNTIHPDLAVCMLNHGSEAIGELDDAVS
jgi:hypothetical protein